MANIVWYEVYNIEPDLFDGDTKISKFASTSDEKEAFELYNDGRNTIKRYIREGTKLKIDFWDPETKSFK